MSLPPTQQARYSLPPTNHQNRKPGFRCLPEIHASRLAVSGSLRPKLGLLLLLVVILVSLCFILIPLLSKVSFSSPQTSHFASLPFISLFEYLSQSSPSSILLSPDLFFSSLALVDITSNSRCGLSHKNSSSVRLAGRVFLGQKTEQSRSCPGVELERIDFSTNKGDKRVREWLEGNGVHYYPDTDNSNSGESDAMKTVMVNLVTVKLHLTIPSTFSSSPGSVPSGISKPVKFSVLAGQFKMASLPTYTTVLMDTFQDDLELVLLLPHSKKDQIVHFTLQDLNLASYGKSFLEIFLPPISLVSHLPVSSSLPFLGNFPSGHIVTQHTSLHLEHMDTSSQSNNSQQAKGSSNKDIPIRLVFDHNFVLLVRDVGQDSILLMGRVAIP